MIRAGTAQRTSERGFTLIEMIVALALMGLLLSALAGITGEWLPSWNRGLDRIQRSELIGIALERIGAEVQAEGWKWVSVHIDYPHAHGQRRAYPQPVELSEEGAAAYAAAQEEYNRLSEEWDGAEELPPEADER